MAERRMFAKTIIDSDAFLDMPLSAQALYFHLSMRADDDGFINNPKKIQRMIGASDDDCKLLIMKRFIITFESGVIVIKHWKIHNYIQKDRYKPTIYQEEKKGLIIKENKAYTECIQNASSMDTQVRLGKVRLELGKDSIEEMPQAAKPIATDTDTVTDFETISETISYLNQILKTRYRPTNKVTQRHIKARIAEGYTLEDFKVVIDKKCTEWKGTNMEKYLRPETLFGTKFENYLNARITQNTARKVGANGIVLSDEPSDLDAIF
jgi:uncharacterized phage protein (TIGR02220 family)